MTHTSFASYANRFAVAGVAAATLAAGLACAAVAAPAADAATTYSTKIMDKSSYFTSKSYDVTGDKKADRLTIKCYKSKEYSDAYTKAKVFINGKRTLTVGAHYDAEAYLFRVKSGRTFLYLKTFTDNGDAISEGVYSYKSGKLKKVLDTDIWPATYNTKTGFYHDHAYISHSGVEDIKVSGNTVKIKFYNMTSIAGTMDETFSFKYKSGKLKLTSNTTSKVTPSYIPNKLTAATTFKIYGKANGTGSVKKVKAGTKVALKAVQLRPSDHFISVKVKTAKGTSGWITYKSFAGKSQGDLNGSTLFKETGMAG